MCTASLAFQGASSALQAYGQYEEGRAHNRALKFNAQIAERNAAISRQQKEDALYRGRQAEFKHRAGVRQLVGRQRAGYAAGGVLVDTGSARDVRKATEYYGEMDALQIRYNAAKEAWGYDVQAGSYDLQSALLRRQRKNEWIQPGVTLLTGTSSILSRYGQLGGNY